MKNTIFHLLCSAILLAATGFAQSLHSRHPRATTTAQAPAQFAPGTVIPAELSKSVDAKKLKAGDQIEAKTAADMLSDGKIVMPRNTKVLGHVTSAKAHSKDSPDSTSESLLTAWSRKTVAKCHFPRRCRRLGLR